MVRMERLLVSILFIFLTAGFTQDEVAVPEEVQVPQEETDQAEDEVVIPQDEDPEVESLLKVGDIAPTWALMYAPAKFEFLRTWTAEKDQRLKRFTTQPERHVVVLSFFATWCKPCMKELPHLENLFQKYGEEKIKFFLVDITEATRNSTGFEDAPKSGPFLADKGITIQVLDDNRGIVKEKYGVATLPRLFVIDKYQTIRLMKQGFHEGEDFEGELSQMIEELLAEAGDS